MTLDYEPLRAQHRYRYAVPNPVREGYENGDTR
jgi:hypothetical protein